MDIDWLMKNYRVLSRSQKQVRSFSSGKKGVKSIKFHVKVRPQKLSNSGIRSNRSSLKYKL